MPHYPMGSLCGPTSKRTNIMRKIDAVLNAHWSVLMCAAV